MKRGQGLIRFFSIAILIIILSGLISYLYFSHVDTVNVGSGEPVFINPQDAVSVDIPLGSSTSDISNILVKNNIINTPFFLS